MRRGVVQPQLFSYPESCPASSDSGWIGSCFQVRRSSREKFPNCHPEYTVHGSCGGICTHMPSPPFTGNQSASVMPVRSRVALGPHHPPLSCNPPHRKYGVGATSTITVENSPIGIS